MIIDRYRRRSHPGQGLPEYAIVIALVALVCIVILGLVGLAATRNYGLVAGALGAKKEVQGSQNYAYFDNNPPQCGLNPHTGSLQFYAQFFSDITDASELTVATDTGLVPALVPNSPGTGIGTGIGNWTVNQAIPAGQSCPISLVIQFPKSKGGGTVAYTVLQKQFP